MHRKWSLKVVVEIHQSNCGEDSHRSCCLSSCTRLVPHVARGLARDCHLSWLPTPPAVSPSSEHYSLDARALLGNMLLTAKQEPQHNKQAGPCLAQGGLLRHADASTGAAGTSSKQTHRANPDPGTST